MGILKQEKNSGNDMQLLFLVVTGLAGFLLVFLDRLYPGYGYLLSEKLLPIPCLMFAGSALTRRLSLPAKKDILLSWAAVLWFGMAQLQHYQVARETSAFGVFVAGYLLAFPFAAVMGEGTGGLKWLGKIYVAAALVPVVCAGMLLTETVPAALTGSVYWDGARLAALWHPNVCASLLLIGIAFTLYFLVRSEKKWMKAALAVLTAVQFCGMALTNSRTSILLACALIGGTIFFAVWKGGWKQFLAGVAAALVVMAALYVLSGKIFAWNNQVQIDKLIAQWVAGNTDQSGTQALRWDEETGGVILAGDSNQGELVSDLKTLNGRTDIWKAAYTAMQDNPSFKTWGTERISGEISYRNWFPVDHAHNSWVQVAMNLGVPGLLLSLVYTALALWNIFVLMWRKNVALEKKVIAMMMLCLVMEGILESYLFVGDLSTFFVRFMFFFGLGCLAHWRREMF